MKNLALNRRRFVQGLMSAGVATLGARYARPSSIGHSAPELSGKDFELTIDKLPVNFTGRSSVAFAVNGSVPGPTLRWKEGEKVRIAIKNRLNVPTSIHWHAMRVPTEMDGVPGLSFAGIPPGEQFIYEFPVLQNGTYWYHSHSGLQEQSGLSGAIIIEPRHVDPMRFDREYVIFLSDWTDDDPEAIFSNLKQDSDFYNYHQPTFPGLLADARSNGLASTISRRMMWARMNMSPTDIADVSGSVYTYLLNGNAPAHNWTGIFNKGEKVRLRFINGSSMTFFDVRIPGLPMTVIAADGNDVEPITVDEFRIGVAETYDVMLMPDEQAYTIFAQSEDRTGFARGTLAPRPGMTAAVPPMDPRPVRTMADMGMKMKSMKNMNATGMNGASNMPGMDSMKSNAGMKEGMDMPAKDGMKGTPGMNGKMDVPAMGSMNGNGAGMKGIEVQADHRMTPGPEHAAMMRNADGRSPFPQPGPATMPVGTASAMKMKPVPSDHPSLHVGPEVVQVAARTMNRQHDPGAGLGDLGRRVLTYSDLRARYRGVDLRPVTREIELHLTGNMERFIWGFNGKKFSETSPIELKLGERVRFVLINDTMMEHPIHLHGLWSELENGHGEFNPYKHTIVVKPAERISYLISADTVGKWAYHCHLMFHMEAGMFRTVVVA